MYKTYLYHHGILGQKWGRRRYQNEDGSYTEAGKKHREYSSSQRKQDERLYGKRAAIRVEKRVNKGETIVSARHNEVELRDKKKYAKKKAKKAFKMTVAATTALTAAYVTTRHPEWIENGKQKAFDVMDKISETPSRIKRRKEITSALDDIVSFNNYKYSQKNPPVSNSKLANAASDFKLANALAERGNPSFKNVLMDRLERNKHESDKRKKGYTIYE